MTNIPLFGLVIVAVVLVAVLVLTVWLIWRELVVAVLEVLRERRNPPRKADQRKAELYFELRKARRARAQALERCTELHNRITKRDYGYDRDGLKLIDQHTAACEAYWAASARAELLIEQLAERCIELR